MRLLLVLPALMASISVGHAQVGPASARVISKPMPTKAPSSQTFNAEAELLVNRRGRLQEPWHQRWHDQDSSFEQVGHKWLIGQRYLADE